MPVTPFHFGPSALIGLPLKRWIDIPVFVLANTNVQLFSQSIVTAVVAQNWLRLIDKIYRLLCRGGWCLIKRGFGNNNSLGQSKHWREVKIWLT